MHLPETRRLPCSPEAFACEHLQVSVTGDIATGSQYELSCEFQKQLRKADMAGRPVCCSDEATFHLNRYKARVWGSQIPHQFIQKERSADGKWFLCHFTAQKVQLCSVCRNINEWKHLSGHINLSFKTHWLVYAPPGSSLKMLLSVQCTYAFHKDLRKKLRLIN